jgi:hypothetical protein
MAITHLCTCTGRRSACAINYRKRWSAVVACTPRPHDCHGLTPVAGDQSAAGKTTQPTEHEQGHRWGPHTRPGGFSRGGRGAAQPPPPPPPPPAPGGAPPPPPGVAGGGGGGGPPPPPPPPRLMQVVFCTGRRQNGV